MFHTVYKITNLLDGMYYIGKHSTENLDDGYMGSSSVLPNLYEQLGKHNFKKEILFIFETSEEALAKEKELVTPELLRSGKVYNINVGGAGGVFCTPGFLTAKLKEDVSYRKIPVADYDPTTHITPTLGTVLCLDAKGNKVRVSRNEYICNKDLYSTFSKGKRTVKCNLTGDKLYIPVEDYDASKHTAIDAGKVLVRDKETGKYSKVYTFDPYRHANGFGGIVTEIDGVKQYVNAETFKKLNLRGVHSGKATVLDTETGVILHVNSDEYHKNRERYKSLTEGVCYAVDKETGSRVKLPKGSASYPDMREKYIFSTAGQITCYNIETLVSGNVNREDFNKNIHKLPSDIKIEWYAYDGTLKFEHFGSKKDLLEKHSITNGIYDKVRKGIPLQGRYCKGFEGDYVIFYDWKTEYGFKQ